MTSLIKNARGELVTAEEALAEAEELNRLVESLQTSLAEVREARAKAEEREKQESLPVRFVNAVKQLCKDFSDSQDRPYMGDVYSALDALLVNEGIRVADEPFPSPQKQSKPCGECRLPEGERCDICGAQQS